MIGGDADVERAIDVGETASEIVRAAGRVEQSVLEIGERADIGISAGQGLLAQRLRQQEATDVQAVVSRIGCVGMCNEMSAKRHVDTDVAGSLIGLRAVLGQGLGVRVLGPPAAAS